MLETRQLHLLQVIADTGSYTAAGKELGLTQPAVTYHVRALEREVGTALTVRRGREMRLTAAGRILLGHAGNVLAAVRAAEEEVGAFAGRGRGHVRLVTFPSASATLVAEALGALRATAPNVETTHLEAEPDPARRLVRRGEADLAVTYRFTYPSGRPVSVAPEESSRLLQIPLLTDAFFVVVHRDHAAAGVDVVDPVQLSEETWMLASERFHWILAAAAESAGFTPRIASVADDYVSMQAFVARGLGVAIVPGLALSAYTHPGVVARPLRGWPVRQVVAELWPDTVRVAAVELVLGALTGAALRARTAGTAPTAALER